MARTPSQRGRIGAWLVQARLARGYSTQADARREIERLTGWRIPQSQYAEWESGRRIPSDSALERLYGFYGVPETHETAAPEGTAALVEAVREQTRELVRAIAARDDVIRELLAELAHYRQQTVAAQTIERSLIEALPEALARALAAMRADDPEPGVPGPPALRVRPG